jgi:hypothetical protein
VLDQIAPVRPDRDPAQSDGRSPSFQREYLVHLYSVPEKPAFERPARSDPGREICIRPASRDQPPSLDRLIGAEGGKAFRERFYTAMDDDFNTAVALPCCSTWCGRSIGCMPGTSVRPPPWALSFGDWAMGGAMGVKSLK